MEGMWEIVLTFLKEKSNGKVGEKAGAGSRIFWHLKQGGRTAPSSKKNTQKEETQVAYAGRKYAKGG